MMVLAAKVLAVGVVEVLAPPLWPVLRLIIVASSRTLPSHALFRHFACRPLEHFAGPTLGLVSACTACRYLLPTWCRTLTLWRRMLPIYAKYMLTRRRCLKIPDIQERHQRWAEVHEWGGERVYSLVLDLSGYYVKAAQILASKAEFMPQQWTVRLAKLFDSMPARPWSQVEHSMRHQLSHSPLAQWLHCGGDLDAVFSWVTPDAVASASVGQVHIARLSAEAVAMLGPPWQQTPQVVVKVQHRDMERLMASDLCNVGRVAKFLRNVLPFDVMPMVVEIQGTIPREFDFQREARLMDAIGGRLREVPSCSGVVVPRPVVELCTPRMLVMQHMEGVPFTQVLRRVTADEELRRRAAAAVEQLLLAFGQMMLGDGLFQADPHPGNLLLQADGKIALLDFGQCKALTAVQQRALARLVLALASEVEEDIAAALGGVGLTFSCADGQMPDKSLMVRIAYVMFDTRPTAEACMSPFVDNPVLAATPITQLPAYLWLLLRSIMLLRGLCHTLSMDVSAVCLWKPLAAAALLNPTLEALQAQNAQLDSRTVDANGKAMRAVGNGNGDGCKADISAVVTALDCY